MFPKSNWIRPLSKVPFPNVWLEFIAKESRNSNKLVKYRIQDLVEDRFDEGIQFTTKYFFCDAPIPKSFGAPKNKAYVEDYLLPCRLQLNSKASLACIREDTDEIAGLMISFVTSKDDTFWTDVSKLVKTEEYNNHERIRKMFHIDLFEKYGVDKYHGNIAGVIAPTYRGTGIIYHILEAQKVFCKAFDIKVTQSFSTTEQAIYTGQKFGFNVDKEYSIAELKKLYPKIDFNRIEAQRFALQSCKFDH